YHTHLIDITRELRLIGIALAYSTNWRLAFGWDLSLDPTAIIWSLSIEEQFYLVWPLLFFACLALKLRRRFIAIGLAVVIVGIVAHRYSLLSAGASLTRLYYGTDTRADALLIGCLIALLPASVVGPNTKKWLSVAGILCGAVFVFMLATADFTDQFLYRGGYTVIALLAGIVILVAANSPPWILAAPLRWRVLGWFGKISYGLYLWHWLVVRSTSFYYLGYWEPWARLALAVAIAAASFYLVERPFNRLKTRFSFKGSAVRSDLEVSLHNLEPHKSPPALGAHAS
ncbi:MAG TPA: acyltransferase, partial [Pyrinomonadaceae bacterium]|nr:acyltransferase [Pyrinomonadaceae bacterium]